MKASVVPSASRSSVLSLPNILTYARIAAIPVVVACMYADRKSVV